MLTRICDPCPGYELGATRQLPTWDNAECTFDITLLRVSEADHLGLSGCGIIPACPDPLGGRDSRS